DTVLYLSIHANTSPFNKTASGFEVWCLPPAYERTLVDEKAAGKENLDILPILNSMREEEISLESTILAQNILSGLDASIGQKSADRGLRQNDWYVVRNARMPAVLTEVGFVSNAEEAPHLADPAYLNEVALGMYSGVKAFIQGLNGAGAAVLNRFDFLLRIRLRGGPAAIGAAFVGTLAISLLLFFVFGNSKVPRILYFPSLPLGRIVAEMRYVPRHQTIEENVEETADNVLLGPTCHDALRLFPRGVTVTAVMASGR